MALQLLVCCDAISQVFLPEHELWQHNSMMELGCQRMKRKDTEELSEQILEIHKILPSFVQSDVSLLEDE